MSGGSTPDAVKAQRAARKALRQAHRDEYAQLKKAAMLEAGWPYPPAQKVEDQALRRLRDRYPDEYRAAYYAARQEIEPGWSDGRRRSPDNARRRLLEMATRRRERAAVLLAEAQEFEKQASEMSGEQGAK
jgi:hypothetical protein